MAFQTSIRAQNAAEKIVKQPNLVVCFDGLDTKYGSAILLEIIRIGDPGLIIDGSWVIGGFREIDDQLNALSIENTTTQLKQQLEIDKGRGSSISSMELGLIDFDQEITQLISRGVLVTDLLGRKTKVYLGFADNTSFPEDYIVIFRGIVDDIKAEQGLVKLSIAHPDQKKRQRIYPKIETEVTSLVGIGDTTINVASTTGALLRASGPSGSPDTSFTSYVKINDEIISYTGLTATSFTGCTRAQFGTVAASHAVGDTVETYYRLQGNVIDLSLKLMLSGWQNYFATGVGVTHFNIDGEVNNTPNTIYFSGINIEEDYGLTVGDYITTTGASNGANNVSLKEIVSVTVNELGSILEIDGVSFVDETDSAATVSFRSQYDSLPAGLRMSPDEVDVAEHLRVQQLFLSSFEYDFYLKDTIEKADEFIEQDLYKPAGAYSLPRKARSSVGYFIGPLPSASTKTIDKDVILNPDKLKTRRTINKNFFNTIVYKYEVDPLEDKFLRGVITQSSTSLSDIPVGNRALVVEAKGMRQILSGLNLAQQASNRRLDRFKFGAEFMEGIDVTYERGYNLEIGDIIILDGEDLNLLNSAGGDRDKPPKFFEIVNKTLNIKTGKVSLDLVDTGFEGFKRYALVGPSSRIKFGISQTQFVIEEYYRSPFGASEYKKWERFKQPRIKVRSGDFTTRFAQSYIVSLSGNTVTVQDTFGFTPQAGDILELSDYDFTGVTDQIKLLYVHMQNAATFPSDGQDQYVQL
jgi:hypothetical protein